MEKVKNLSDDDLAQAISEVFALDNEKIQPPRDGVLLGKVSSKGRIDSLEYPLIRRSILYESARRWMEAKKK